MNKYELFDLTMGFYRNNRDAMQMLNQGTNDYIAGRCLILSGLLAEGFTISAQGVEKLMKAHFRLRGGSREFREIGHSMSNLVEALKDDTTVPLDITSDSDFVSYLYECYQRRYPDNISGDISYNNSESLDRLDKLCADLLNNELILPSEVEVVNGVTGVIYHFLERPQSRFNQDFHWLTLDNKVIASEWIKIKKKCDRIIDLNSKT